MEYLGEGGWSRVLGHGIKRHWVIGISNDRIDETDLFGNIMSECGWKNQKACSWRAVVAASEFTADSRAS